MALNPSNDVGNVISWPEHFSNVNSPITKLTPSAAENTGLSNFVCPSPPPTYIRSVPSRRFIDDRRVVTTPHIHACNAIFGTKYIDNDDIYSPYMQL